MSEVEIVVVGKNMAAPALNAAGTQVRGLSARAEELALALRKAALSAATAGTSAQSAMTAAAAAADKAAASHIAAAEAAKKLAAGEISAEDAAKAEAVAVSDAAKAADLQARASLAAQRANIVQAESAKKAGEAQMVAAGETKKASAETSAWSKVGGVAGAAWDKLKLGILGVGVAAGVSIDKAAKFDVVVARLATSADEPRKNLDMLSKSMVAMSSQVGVSANKLAEAMYYVASSGYHGADGLKVLKAAAQGAGAEGADTTNVVKALTDVLVDYHMKVSQAADVTSKMVEAVSNGRTNLQDFSKAFASIVPAASAAGISLDDTMAALARMTAHGYTAQRGAQNLADALRHLITPNGPMKKAFDEYGVSADTLKAKLNGPNGLTDAMEYLSKAAEKAGKVGTPAYASALKSLMGTASGANAALANTGKNFGDTQDALRKIGKAAADAKGNVQGFGDIQKTTAQKGAELKARLEALAITFGHALMPALNPVADALNKALANPEVSKGLEEFGKYLGQVVQAATPLLPIMMKLGEELMKALGPALPPIANALVKVGSALGKSLGDVIKQLAPYLPKLAKAFGDVLIALIPLIPSIAKVITAFLPLMPTITRGIEVMAKIIAKVVEFIAWWDGKLSPALKKGVQIFEGVTKAIWKVWKWLYDELIGHSIIPDMINGMTSWFRRGVNDVKNIINWFTNLPGMFSKWMSGMVNAVSKGAGDAVGWFKGLPGRITGALGNFGSLLYGAGQNVIRGLINGINSMIGSVGSAISGIADMIRSHLPFSPAKVGPLSGEGSPDKSGAKIGVMLAAGMKSSGGAVGDAAAHLAHLAHVAHQEHMEALRRVGHGRGHHGGSHHGRGRGHGGSGGTSGTPFVGDLTWSAGGVRYTVGRGGSSGSAAGSSGGSGSVGSGGKLEVVFDTMHIELDLKDTSGRFGEEDLRELRKLVRIKGGSVQRVLGH